MGEDQSSHRSFPTANSNGYKTSCCLGKALVYHSRVHVQTTTKQHVENSLQSITLVDWYTLESSDALSVSLQNSLELLSIAPLLCTPESFGAQNSPKRMLKPSQELLIGAHSFGALKCCFPSYCQTIIKNLQRMFQKGNVRAHFHPFNMHFLEPSVHQLWCTPEGLGECKKAPPSASLKLFSQAC